eukprot:TRINITY_DN806_c0_g2_i1.p1 TRINITY_DN806_c0_g2~~TRINITY_DN806_c0_g2_i1.p1  ORF type:complete len:243 (+),score=32.56 TRINITY_DN806_c0_g2_i1:270-998(+)
MEACTFPGYGGLQFGAEKLCQPSLRKDRAKRYFKTPFPRLGSGFSTIPVARDDSRGLRGSARPSLQVLSAHATADPRREIDKSEILLEDPYGAIESAMSSQVVTTTPDATLDTIMPLFEHYTGLPVVDEAGRCVGIISNIDVARRARGPSLTGLPQTPVRDVMTSPAYVILERAPVAYAAGLMLQHKVHRLPVVNTAGVVVGIVTRTDLFKPLMPDNSGAFYRLIGAKPVDINADGKSLGDL